MVWSTEKIKREWQRDPTLIAPYDFKQITENPAKVYLHLGEQCYCSSRPDHILKLDAKNPEVVIQPNDIFLFQTKERVRLPYHAAGRLSLRMEQITKGLIASNLPQIDPGYHNHLFGMAYNLSAQPVTLRYQEPIVVLELYTVEAPQRDKSFTGDMQSMIFPEFVRSRIGSSLGQLEKDTNQALRKVETARKWLGGLTFAVSVIAVAVAIAALISTGAGIRGASRDDAEIRELQLRLEELNRTAEAQAAAIRRLEARLAALGEAPGEP